MIGLLRTVNGRRLLFGMSGALLLVTITLVWKMRPTHAARIADLILRNRCATNDWTPPIQDALTCLLWHTPFEHRWQVNRPPRADCLNIYVLRRGVSVTALPEELADVTGSCQYVGAPNIVVLDAGFLETFLAEHGAIPASGNIKMEDYWQHRYQQALLLWVLGHEIGHIIHHHQPAHFGPHGFDKMVGSSSIAQWQEVAADAFAMTQLQRDRPRSLAVTDMLISLINADIRHRVKSVPYGVGLIYDYRSKTAVEYAEQGEHPEYIVRCVRMLQVAPIDPGLKYTVNDLASRMRAKKP